MDPGLKEPIDTIVRNFQPAVQNMAPKTTKAPGTPNAGGAGPAPVGPPGNFPRTQYLTQKSTEPKIDRKN